MPGDRLFDPSNNLSIRHPQDNASHSARIVNPPRYMELGGIESKGARGFHKNTFAIKTPSATQQNVPFTKFAKNST